MKRVYTFGDGKAEGNAEMRNLLGGKGANLAEMNLLGMPVPPGFTITTEVCTEYTLKGRDAVDLLQRHVQALGHHPLHLDGQVAVDLLRKRFLVSDAALAEIYVDVKAAL